MLPLEVLEEAQKEFLDFAGTGMSVTEISHRDKAFSSIVEEAEANLRELMNIPDNYCVLFVQGGASQQFAAIPLNLMKSGKADYIVTGNFAKKLGRKAKFTATRAWLHLPKTKLILISPMWIKLHSTTIPITYTSLPTTRFSVHVISNSRKQKRLWCVT